MFKLKRKKAHLPGLVGVSVDADGLALAHAVRRGADVQLRRCAYVPVPGRSERAAALADAVHAHELAGARTVFVLGPEDYALRVLDAPDVPEAELRAAARWSIREMVDFDVEKAVVDVFEVPTGETDRDGKRIYVVATREETVESIDELARGAGLELLAIDTSELALRNVAALHPRDAQGLAVLHLRRDLGLITISREGALYVARWVDVSHDALAEALAKHDFEDAEPEPGGEIDAVLLELQRSLDYYEHQLRQRPVSALALAPLDADLAALGQTIAQGVRLPLELLDLSELLQLADALPAPAQARALLAVGGALRAEGAA